MQPSTRLRLSGTIIIMSVLFAVLIAADPTIASAVSSAYVAVVLTVIVLTQTWKRP